MPSRSEVIGEEWRDRARDLADWAMERLVNRRDVWGQYSPLTPAEQRKSGRSYRAMTLPQRKMRGEDMVSLEKLARHFSSVPHQQQIIGLHAKSDENTSRWLAIDIDMHDPDSVEAPIIARRNLLGALAWWERLESLGHDPLLLDSNGMGGFHLIVLFQDACPTTDVFAFGQSLIADWEEQGLYEEPETFPRSPGKKGSLGSWLRLPGLHHTRPHHTRVWSGDEWLDDPWLAGGAAIEALLEAMPGPPPTSAADLPDEVPDRSRPTGKVRSPGKRSTTRRARFTPTARPRVCLDLDGVLARHIPWQGPDVIGDPIDGAVEFSRQLAEQHEIVILTSRFARATRKPGLREIESALREWLDRHGFAYDSIHTGLSKPPAVAYLDDRALPCRPENDGPKAFADALARLKAR